MYARKGATKVAAKDDHHGTRQRYTILTYVPSWQPAPGMPPKVAVLFKAESGGQIARDLKAPDWMLVQFQEKGSYRAGDVVQALQWGLEPATSSQTSAVVLLD